MNSIEVIQGIDIELTFTFLDNGNALDLASSILTFVVDTPTPISLTLTPWIDPTKWIATGIITHTQTEQAPGIYKYYTKFDDWSGNITITDKWYFILSEK